MADSPDLAHADPGTHALLMGVGKDPHLTGGDGPSSQAADGMQQLSSPAVPPAQLRTGCSPSSGFPDKRLASQSLLRSEAEPKRSSTRGRVRNRRGAQPIDVLVITHVDQDHILGVLTILKDVERPGGVLRHLVQRVRPAERQRVRKLRTRGR